MRADRATATPAAGPLDILYVDSSGGLGDRADVADTLFQRPLFRFPVSIAGSVVAMSTPPGADWALGFDGFLKVGAKSWRDAGSLMIVPAHTPFAARAAEMLCQLSPIQTRYLDQIRPLRSTIDLSVFRYVDFSDISEARWAWRNGVARQSSRCRRGRSADIAAASDDGIRMLFDRLAVYLPASANVDFAIEANGRISVLDVNPPA